MSLERMIYLKRVEQSGWPRVSNQWFTINKEIAELTRLWVQAGNKVRQVK